jgi:hypothetical protein
MARRWADELSDITDIFPDVIYSPIESKDFSPSAYTAADYTDDTLEGGAWVVAAPLKYYLDFRPKRGTLSITLDAVPVSLVEDTAPTGVGVVRINYISGEIQFHVADTGKTPAAVYKHWGSVLDAPRMMRLEKHVEAMETFVQSSRAPIQFYTPVAGATSAAVPGHGRIYLPQSAATLTVTGIWIFSSDIDFATGDTIFKLTTQATTAGFVENTNGVTTGTIAAAGHSDFTAKSWPIDLDVGGGQWLNLFCTAAGNHQDITIGVTL